jgi:hypothetical protein
MFKKQPRNNKTISEAYKMKNAFAGMYCGCVLFCGQCEAATAMSK